MGKENTSLLLKMVKLVSKPLTDWSEPKPVEPEAEERYSKQMLKEMIERRRRNDFVRMREFDMLRKVRLRGTSAGALDQAALPSFLQSTMETRPDDRAVTLKKINDIEAQMSQQWWKTRHGDATKLQTGMAGMSVQAAPSTPASPATTLIAPSPAAATAAHAPTAFAATSLSTELRPHPATVPDAPSVAPASGLKSTLFSPSEMNAFFVDEGAHDPDLEEAAIRFANGDDEGAASNLRDALGKDKNRPANSELWLALFDLYRVTHQADEFDRLALDYAIRYGRSAPVHYTMPESLGKGAQAMEFDAGSVHWSSPATLNSQALGNLAAVLGRINSPWRLNWSALQTLDASALEPLARLLSDWMGKPVELSFMGEKALLDALADRTPTGNAATPARWWMLRMDALRLTRRHEDFDSVALDYCVTYEVSPPSWVEPQGQYRNLERQDILSVRDSVGARDSTTSPASVDFNDSFAPSRSSLSANRPGQGRLSGEISGDIHALLDEIEDRMVGADAVTIACDSLIRVDFAAAGTLLNWVSTQAGNGRQIEFKDLHCLVAVLFNVIGIDQHARVSLHPQ